MRSDEFELPTTSNPFFRMQELMFLPREKDEEKNEKYIQEVEQEVKKLKEYCSKYTKKSPKGSRLITPRAYRIYNEYIIANLEPVLARAAFVTSNCNLYSVGYYTYVLQDYYNSLPKPYIGAEMMQVLVGRMIFGGYNWMSYEQEPIYYFNKKRGVIGSYDEEYYDLNEAEYTKIDERLNANISDSKCIYLKIGRFSTKQDVKWFIDNYWEKMTEGMPNTKRCELRMTEKRLRTLLTDCMIACGLRTGDIIGIIDRVFPVLDNSYKNAHPGDVNKGTIDKARKDLNKRLKVDAFDMAYSDLLSLRGKRRLTANPLRNQRKVFLLAENDPSITKRALLKFRVVDNLPNEVRLKLTQPITVCNQDDLNNRVTFQAKI